MPAGKDNPLGQLKLTGLKGYFRGRLSIIISLNSEIMCSGVLLVIDFQLRIQSLRSYALYAKKGGQVF